MLNMKKDVGYRGPLSYRWLRLIALLALSASQYAVIYRIVVSFMRFVSGAEEMAQGTIVLLNVLQLLGNITFPLLLVASFSIILRDRTKIRRVLISNGILALLTYLFIAFFAERVIYGLLRGVPEAMMENLPAEHLIPLLIKQLTVQLANADGTINADAVARLTAIADKAGITSLIGALGRNATFAELLEMIKPMLTGTNIAKMGDLAMTYLPGLVNRIQTQLVGQLPAFAEMGTVYVVNNYLNANVFGDLFLCTLFYFFTTYTPKNLRDGKLMLFRCCAVLPAIYMIVSMVLSGMIRSGYFVFPAWAVGLLSSRNLPHILLFFLLVLFLKYRELQYYGKGGTPVGYAAYLETNENSLQFSVFLCLVIALIAAVDYGFSFVTPLANWGLGTNYGMWMSIPVLLLFSYSRRTKHAWVDGFVPVYYIVHYVLLSAICIGLLSELPEWLEMLASTMP